MPQRAKRCQMDLCKKLQKMPKKMPNVKSGYFIVSILPSGHVEIFSITHMRDVYFKIIILGYELISPRVRMLEGQCKRRMSGKSLK